LFKGNGSISKGKRTPEKYAEIFERNGLSKFAEIKAEAIRRKAA